KYIGCSAQSVPSLSKTAMRSAGGTKSVPSVVTLATKAVMAFFGAVSFHDGSGSAACRTARPSRERSEWMAFIWIGENAGPHAGGAARGPTGSWSVASGGALERFERAVDREAAGLLARRIVLEGGEEFPDVLLCRHHHEE